MKFVDVGPKLHAGADEKQAISFHWRNDCHDDDDDDDDNCDCHDDNFVSHSIVFHRQSCINLTRLLNVPASGFRVRGFRVI